MTISIKSINANHTSFYDDLVANKFSTDELDYLFKLAAGNSLNIKSYKLQVVSKMSELYNNGVANAQDTANFNALFTDDLHKQYMSLVLADAINTNFTFTSGTYTQNNISGLNLKFKESGGFLNTTSIDVFPPNFERSYEFLIKTLAGSDKSAEVTGTTAAVNVTNIKDAIKTNLANDPNVKSLGQLAASLSGEEKTSFFQNLNQQILLAGIVPLAEIRSTMRAAECVSSNSGYGGSDFNNTLYSHSNPYGGRIVPLNFYANNLAMNPITTSPFSFMFFRDINTVDQVPNTRFGIFKRIVHDGELHEVPLDFKIKAPIFRDQAGVLQNVPTAPQAQPQNATKKLVDCSTITPNVDLNTATVESCNVSFKGTTPTTAQNDVDVDLQIHIPHMKALNHSFMKKNYEVVKNDGTLKKINYSWSVLDLITYKNTIQDEKGFDSILNNKYKPVNSRIIIKFGYDFSTTKTPEILQKVLKKTDLILDLNLIDHTIEKDKVKHFVKIKLKFKGFIQKMFNSPATDILSDEKTMQRKIERDRILRTAYQAGCNQSQINDLAEQVREINKSESSLDLASFINRLYDRKRIFRNDFTGTNFIKDIKLRGKRIIDASSVVDHLNSIINVVKGAGTAYNYGKILEYTSEYQKKFIKDVNVNTAKTEKQEVDRKKIQKVIHWTYLGDIIDVAMDSICEKNSPFEFSDAVPTKYYGRSSYIEEKMLGTFKDYPIKVLLTNFRTLYGDEVNIADVPVSMEFFRNFFEQEIMNQNYDYYPLASFIRILIQTCLSNFMNSPDQGYNLEADRRNLIFGVETHLGLPELSMPQKNPPSGKNLITLAAANQTSLNNLMNSKEYGHAFKKDKNDYYNGSVNFNTGPFEKLNSFFNECKYKMSCEIRDVLDKTAFGAANVPFPLIQKSYDTPRAAYINYIVCHAFDNVKYFGNKVKSVDDCYKMGIPVIMHPDYQFVKYTDVTERGGDPNADTEGVLGEVDTSVDNEDPNTGSAQPQETRVESKKDSNCGTASGNGVVIEKENVSPVVVRSISFQKKDDDYLREARFSSDQYGLFSELTSVYSATVELATFCSFLFPGQLVYIDANIGSNVFQKNSLSYSLGLGGLHVITSVDHKAELDSNQLKKVVTTFNAVYSFVGDGFQANQKTAPKGVRRNNTLKSKVCDSLYGSLTNSNGTTAGKSSTGTGVSATLTTTELSVVYPPIESVDEQAERVSYYGDDNIKKVYYDMFIRINKFTAVTDGHKQMTYNTSWSQDSDQDTVALYNNAPYIPPPPTGTAAGASATTQTTGKTTSLGKKIP